MKNCKLFLFSSMLVSSLAFGQQKHASIVVLADSSAGETMYLTRFRGPMLDYERVDSARVDVDRRAHFSLIPDPLKPYQIQRTAPDFRNRIYLAAGDSLIFSYSSAHGDSLLFDRIGANRSFRDSIKPWDHDMKHLFKNMDSLDWNSWRAYLESRKPWFENRIFLFTSQYPEHTGFRDMYANEEIMQYYNMISYYLIKHYWDSTGKPIINDPNRLRVMDSVPWTNPVFSQSPEVMSASLFWLNFAWKRWKNEGVDTAGKIYGEDAFQLAHTLPAPARDAAELSILWSCTNRYNPITGPPLAEREFQTYKTIAYDTAYLGAFNRMRMVFHGQIPGKPAPTFKLPDLANEQRSLSGFRGKIVYLEFWGTWCGPCREEIPALNALEKKFEADTNVAFVSIALQNSNIENQRMDAWRKFVSDNQLHGNQLFGEDRSDNDVAEAYGVSAVPAFMLIDRNGNFIDAAAPRPSSGKAERAIRAALSEP